MDKNFRSILIHLVERPRISCNLEASYLISNRLDKFDHVSITDFDSSNLRVSEAA